MALKNRNPCPRLFAVTLGLILSLSRAFAGSATWLLAPSNSDWNIAANWTPGGPPNGETDSATFGSSTVNAVSLSANTQVSSILFRTGGTTAYTITSSPTFALTISGLGITNNSGITQNFVAAGNNGLIRFTNDATAGFTTAFTTNGGTISGAVFGVTEFRDHSKAGTASFTTNGGAVPGAFGGVTQFFDNSAAGTGIFTNNGGAVPGAGSGVTLFFNTSSAGDASFTNRSNVSGAGGGLVAFLDNSTAAKGAFTNNGGSVSGASSGATQFFDSSTAGNGTFTNSGGGAPFAPGGVTQFFDHSTAGNAFFTINGGAVSGGSGALMQFLNASTAANGTFTTNGGAFSGEGGGTTEFRDNSSAGNGTFITNGITANFAGGGLTLFRDNSSAGSATFITNGGGTSGATGGGLTQFLDNSNAGNATFTTNGAPVTGGFGGVTEFRINSGAGNATFTINGGTFQGPHTGGNILFFETATAANATLIANGGTGGGNGGLILFANGSKGGTARIEVFGNAGLDISGQNERGLTIGSIEGTGRVFLGSNKLSVGSNGLNTTFSGVIQDGGVQGTRGGALTKIGTGTLTLSGNNTYLGDTHVDGGSLLVDGSIASPNSFVSPLGLLGGTGTVGGSVASSGIVNPGDSGPGRLTLNGSYTQSTSGTLQIEIAGLTSVHHDLLGANGTAQLNGALQLARLNNFHFLPGDKVTFLTAAGGVAGTFATVTNPFNDTIVLTKVVYEANQVSLEASQGSFASLSGLTPNQRAVANNLDLAAIDPRAGELIGFLNTELLGHLPRDYDLIAPEELASIYETGFSQARMQSLNLQRRMDEIRDGSTGFSASGFTLRGNGRDYSDGKTSIASTSSEKQSPLFNPSPENRWGAFVTGAGEVVNIGNEDMNAGGYDITTGGVTLGLDFRTSPNFALGVNVGYAHGSADLVANGRVTVAGGKAGIYATYFSGGFYLDSAVGAGWNTYDTRRSTLGGYASGKTDGAEFNAMIGTGYDWKKGTWSFGPTATLQYSDVGIHAFNETHSLGSLEIPEQNENAFRSALGVKASYDWKMCGMVVRPDISVGWQHEYGDQSYPIDARFASGAGEVFTVRGPVISRNKAAVGAAVAIQWSSSLLTHLYYQAEVGSNYTSHSAGAGVSVSF
ncbi:MAG: hypothetical protein QOJ45_2858 [Verrucomicrobiota bacterium]|jgi:autotransporter-associated beta strand protein